MRTYPLRISSIRCTLRSILFSSSDYFYEPMLKHAKLMQEAVQKLLAFDISNGDLHLFFEDILPCQP